MVFKNKKLKIGMLLVATLIATMGVYVIWANVGPKNTWLAEAKQELSLVHPVFAQSMAAATTFLDREAGLALYVNVAQTLELSLAKLAFRTIEYNTSDYVIGSISIPTNPQGDLPVTEDAHCFVHKEGWIVVYYRNSEPASKMVDWGWWTGTTLTKNKLQSGLEKMGTATGVTVGGAKYYDFNYPDASKLMLVIRASVGAGSRSFNISLPSSFTFYEESWSHFSGYAGTVEPSILKIDTTEINRITGGGSHYEYGQLVSPLSLNVVHNVAVSGIWGGVTYGAGIVLVYKEI